MQLKGRVLSGTERREKKKIIAIDDTVHYVPNVTEDVWWWLLFFLMNYYYCLSFLLFVLLFNRLCVRRSYAGAYLYVQDRVASDRMEWFEREGDSVLFCRCHWELSGKKWERIYNLATHMFCLLIRGAYDFNRKKNSFIVDLENKIIIESCN